MNIFYLHKNPEICAQQHCDTHVVKMCLETAQLLSTVKRFHLSQAEANRLGLYAKTHTQHPSTRWLAMNKANYAWTVELFDCLLAEYKHRYKKTHASASLFGDLQEPPKGLLGTTPNVKVNLVNADQVGRRGASVRTQQVNYKEKVRFTPPTPAMDTTFLRDHNNKPIEKGVFVDRRKVSSLHSYRNYYANGKANLLQYTNRETPSWLEEYQENDGMFLG